jgi:hypothetical protein
MRWCPTPDVRHPRCWLVAKRARRPRAASRPSSDHRRERVCECLFTPGYPPTRVVGIFYTCEHIPYMKTWPSKVAIHCITAGSARQIAFRDGSEGPVAQRVGAAVCLPAARSCYDIPAACKRPRECQADR